MLNKLFAILTLAVGAFAQAPPTTTTVNGPIYDFFGMPFNGSVVVQGPVLISTGQPVSSQVKTVTITNGALTLQLVPNNTAIPTATQYVMTFSSGEKWTCIVKAGPPMPFANDQTNGGACTQAPTNASLPVYQFLPVTGDVTIDPTGRSTTNLVGGQTAADVAAGSKAANAATNANTPGTIVKRDSSGAFDGAFNGNAATASALAPVPSICSTISYTTGISAQGNSFCTPGIINVASFDAIPAKSCAGDPTHDDRPAAQAALNFAGTKGSGYVSFPSNGSCNFLTTLPGGNGTLVMTVANAQHNLTVDWNGAVPHYPNAAWKNVELIGTAGFTTAVAALPNKCSILPAVRGQWYIDLNGACGSYTFHLGDAIYLQSGRVAAGTPFNAEMNEVSWIGATDGAGGTERLYLSYSLVHPYSNDGTNPFGVVDAETQTVHNITIRNLHTPPNFEGSLFLVQGIKILVEDSTFLRATLGTGLATTGNTRNFTFRNVTSTNIDPGQQLQFSTGMADTYLDHVNFTCYTTGHDRFNGYSTQLDISEGASNIYIINGSTFSGNCGSGNISTSNNAGLYVLGAKFDLTNAGFHIATSILDLDIEGSTFNFSNATGPDIYMGGPNCRFVGNRIYSQLPDGQASIRLQESDGCVISGNTGVFSGRAIEIGQGSTGAGHNFTFTDNNFTGTGNAFWGVGLEDNGVQTKAGPTITGNTVTGFQTGILVVSLAHELSYKIELNNLGGNTTAPYNPASLNPVSGISHLDAGGHVSASPVALGSEVSGTLPCANQPAYTGDVTVATGTCAATVSSVGGSTAGFVHQAELAANAATNANTPGTIVKRDSNGAFNGSINGNAATASALAPVPSGCSTISYTTGISAQGNSFCTPGIINVASFDAIPAKSCAGDPTHDDRPAGQAAINFAGASHGGVVMFPHNGDCHFLTTRTGAANSGILAIPLQSHNITVDFNGAIPNLNPLWTPTATKRGVAFLGPAIITNADYVKFLPNRCSMQAASRGQWYLDLNGPCAGYTFAAGHAVNPQSGLVIGQTMFNTEMNQISYIDPTGGAGGNERLYLVFPLSHNYSNDGTPLSGSNNGQYPYGIVDADAQTNYDLIIRNLHTPPQWNAYLGLIQGINTVFEDSSMLTAPNVLPWQTGYTKNESFHNIISTAIDPGEQLQVSSGESFMHLDHVTFGCYTTGNDWAGGYSSQMDISEGASDIYITGSSRFYGNCGWGNGPNANTSGLHLLNSELDLDGGKNTEFRFGSGINDLDIEGMTFKFPAAQTGRVYNMVFGGPNCKFTGNKIFSSLPDSDGAALHITTGSDGCVISQNTGTFAGRALEIGGTPGHNFTMTSNNFTGTGNGLWGIGLEDNGVQTKAGPMITGNTVTGFQTGILVVSLAHELSYKIELNNLGGNTTAPYNPASLNPDVIHTAAGAPIGACDSTNNSTTAKVGDAVSFTPHGQYVSGGMIQTQVYCEASSTHWLMF